MPYIINLTNTAPLVTVADGTVELAVTDIALLGRNFPGYGEYLNENLVHMLENFARSSAPQKPLVGQLWYDTSTSPGTLRVYTGVSINGSAWSSAGSGISSDQLSTGLRYLTFVSDDTGSPPLSTAKDKGLVFQPSSGNVGIAMTTVPGAKFVINNSSNRSRTLSPTTADAAIHVHGDDGASSSALFDSYTTTVNQGSPFNTSGIVFRTSRGTSAAKLGVQSGDYLGAVNSRGYNGTDYSTNTTAFVSRASELWTSSAQGSRYEWWNTTNGTTQIGLKMILDHNGDLKATGDVTAFHSSDRRLKTEIQTISGALDRVSALDGVTYKWNELAIGKDQTQTRAGVIAQQIAEVLPEAVETKDSGYLGVDYTQIVPLLIEAVKELRAEVEALKNR